MTLTLPLEPKPLPISFWVPGDPQSKARPRTFYSEKAGRVFTVTPDNTKAYEKAVHLHALEGRAFAKWPAARDTDRFTVRIELYFATAGAYKRDLDNVAKAVLDGMHGVFYADDFQVCGLTVTRNMKCAKPGARVLVRLVDEVVEGGP